MKRTALYLGLLLAILGIAQFIQMNSGANRMRILSKHDSNSYSRSFLGKSDLLRKSTGNNLEDPGIFFTDEQDVYLLKDTLKKTIQWLEVIRDSPPEKDSILFHRIELPYKNYNLVKEKHRLLDSLSQLAQEEVTLTKQELKQTIISAHSVQAAVVSDNQNEDLDWGTRLYLSPFIGPLLLLVFVLLFWGVDKIAIVLATLFRQPKCLVLFIPFLTFIVWITVRQSQFHDAIFQENNTSWSHWITWQIVVSLLFIPGFLLFYFFKRRFFDAWSFVDAEAGKFAYLFFLLIIGNGLHSYLDAKIFSQLDTLGTQIWMSRQIPAFALLFATANFLNNFRKRFYQLNRKEKALGEAQKSDLQSQANLAALQAKVNPHFLYNSLNSIASLAKQDPEKTEAMTLALSEFYKYSTNRQNNLWSTVGEELTLIENYLVVEHIRFGEQLVVNVECDSSVKEFPLPYFLLQPLVENAVKFGYNHEGKIEISISLEHKKNDLIIQIIDSGSPFLEDMQLGYGIKSVQQKLKLLYPGKHEIDFINFPKKAIVITLKSVDN